MLRLSGVRPISRRKFEESMNIIIVGAGIAGLSTAWSLVKAGHNVSIVEQGKIPNPLAASGDHHRIIRRAYRASTGYGALITEAYDAWDEMWTDLGESHLDARGFICVSREPGDEAEEYREGMEAGGWPIELLEPDAAAARWRFLEAGHVPLRVFFAGWRRAALPKDRLRASGVAPSRGRQHLRRQQGQGNRRRGGARDA